MTYNCYFYFWFLNFQHCKIVSSKYFLEIMKYLISLTHCFDAYICSHITKSIFISCISTGPTIQAKTTFGHNFGLQINILQATSEKSLWIQLLSTYFHLKYPKDDLCWAFCNGQWHCCVLTLARKERFILRPICYSPESKLCVSYITLQQNMCIYYSVHQNITRIGITPSAYALFAPQAQQLHNKK